MHKAMNSKPTTTKKQKLIKERQGVVAKACNPPLGRLMEEEHVLEANWSYIMTTCLNPPPKQHKKVIKDKKAVKTARGK
jgi:hypothetical protein